MEKNEKVTKSNLRERGWTEKMIKVLLPEPEYKRNPRYHSQAPMQLWPLELVEAIEKTEEYKILLEKAERRRQAAYEVRDRKYDELMEEVDQRIAEIYIPRIPIENLMEESLDAKIYWELERRPYLEFEAEESMKNAELEVRKRWAVNYIRHRLTPYDGYLSDLKGRVGTEDAYHRYRNALMNAIFDTYPCLRPKEE